MNKFVWRILFYCKKNIAEASRKSKVRKKDRKKGRQKERKKKKENQIDFILQTTSKKKYKIFNEKWSTELYKLHESRNKMLSTVVVKVVEN